MPTVDKTVQAPIAMINYQLEMNGDSKYYCGRLASITFLLFCLIPLRF